MIIKNISKVDYMIVKCYEIFFAIFLLMCIY